MSHLPEHVEAEFPVKVDCAMDISEMAMPAEAGSKKGKKSKPKPVYPTLFLGNCDLGDIPSEGYALIYFRRRRQTTNIEEDGEKRHSSELEVQELCLPEGGGADDSLEDAMTGEAKKRGVIPKDEEEDDYEEED